MGDLELAGLVDEPAPAPAPAPAPSERQPTPKLSLFGRFSKKKKAEYIQEAIVAHLKHLDVADAGGAFVAHTNLGLAYSMCGEISNAAKHHQDALRSSIKMQSIYGQSIAVGNLGLLAMLKGDKTTARTCFEQHVQLIQALQDPEAEVNAWKLLACLAIEEDNHADEEDETGADAAALFVSP